MKDPVEAAGSPPLNGLVAATTSKRDHISDLTNLQGGEGAFVWARHRTTGELWFLDEDTGRTNRPFVRENLECPVPGCAQKLTSAHRSTKRDGLQHYSGSGGHSLESIFHSQGCALIESWLTKAYPKHKVHREEYTNESGERRADVLITAPNGSRVAFEIQYSPITPDAWRARHDSYRAQKIVDVWLFGHTKHHLNLDPVTQRLRPNPTQIAVVQTGSPLLFINPEHELIGFAVNEDFEYDAHTDSPAGPPVLVLDRPIEAAVYVRPLSHFRADRIEGLTSDLLRILHNSTNELRQLNWDQEHRAAELRRVRKRFEQLEADAQRVEDEKRHQKVVRINQPRIAHIRQRLGIAGSWVDNGAYQAIWEYLGTRTTDRIARNFDVRNLKASDLNVLTRWQCVIYFELIAGRENWFGTKDAFTAIVSRGVKMGQPDAFKLIARYLYQLEEIDILERHEGGQRYPTFKPTRKGAWY